MLTVRTSENTVITSFRLISERQDFSSVRTGENTVRARARIQFDGATGDGLLMAQRIGAATKDAEYLQLIPFWGGRLLDYVGGDIYVNTVGKRFVNEGGSWKEVSEAILKQPEREIWAITDSQSQKGASLGIKLMNKVIRKADSIEEMAVQMKVPKKILKETLETYNHYATQNLGPVGCITNRLLIS